MTRSADSLPGPDPAAPLRIGTRSSRLARWQSEWVAAQLQQAHPGLDVLLVNIRTHGDRDHNSPLAAIGGQGLFTKEIQHALLNGTIDLAVHSLKDLPTVTPPTLLLAAVPAREAVADALIAPRHHTLAALPPAARIGTSSQRRRAMLLHRRPDLRIENLRGNIETRLAAATSADFDAVLLAEAGLRRLGLQAHITERLAPPDFLPAVGQGALGLECRLDDARTRHLLAALDHPPTHQAVAAERALLAALHGGCVLPIAAYARILPGDDPASEPICHLDAAVFDPNGQHRLTAATHGPAHLAVALGQAAAADLLAQGADRLLGHP